MYMNLLVSMFMCMLTFLLLMLVYKHMLIILMILELIVLNISLFMYMTMSMVNMEFFMIYYVVFSICESILGLALLVLILRYSGNDYYYMMNMSKF